MESITLSPSTKNVVDDIVIEDISEDTDFASTDSKSDQTVFSPIPRAKTRLLSRSLSVSDISGVDHLKIDFEPLRRNSSGEHNQSFLVQTSPLRHPELNQPNLTSLNDKSNQYINIVESNNSDTTLSVLPLPANQLSPISLQLPNHHPSWKPQNKIVIPQEDTFTVLLQTTAERVLNRLKSRQQDLGKNIAAGKKLKKHSPNALQTVPRKLQPLLRDRNKASPYRQDSVNSDGKSDGENNSVLNL